MLNVIAFLAGSATLNRCDLVLLKNWRLFVQI